jgi:hypothetical protein
MFLFIVWVDCVILGVCVVPLVRASKFELSRVIVWWYVRALNNDELNERCDAGS